GWAGGGGGGGVGWAGGGDGGRGRGGGGRGYGVMARTTGRSSGEPFSTWEISRASDLASPSRAAATSAAARESAGTLSVAARLRDLEQQRVALAAPAAQRGCAEPTALPPELVDQGHRE